MTLSHDLDALIDRALLVALTREMVAIPTQNPPGNEQPCAALIHHTLSGWGIEAEFVPAPDPERPQVVAYLRGAEPGPTVILNGHMDTVSVGDPAAWSYPPLEATLVDGRLYGRGTADMKGALAIAMVVMKALKGAGRPRAGTLMFQAVMGEEMDEPGTKTLLQMGYTGDHAIVLEPTDLRIGPGTRGACWHRIAFKGKSVHCGLIGADEPDTMQAVADFGVGIAELHQRISRQRHHLLASPACRIVQMEAGTAHNATAGECRLVVDRRMLPHESYKSVTEELTALLDAVVARHRGIVYEIEFIAGNEATETPLDAAVVGALDRAHQAVRGQPAEIWGPPYGCDMRNFVCDAGIPTTNFGPGDYRVCHQPNEFVEVEDLVTCARIVARAALDLMEKQEPAASA